MAKRTTNEPRPRDFWPTPIEAVKPLLPFLNSGTRFVEPCAGDGALIDHLTNAGHVCAAAWDIHPLRGDIVEADATTKLVGNIDCFITNPPWSRDILHPLITHLSGQAPTWLLFDADWVHTKQSIPLLPRLRKIVSVGRVRWIPDSPSVGYDNVAWHLFDAWPSELPPRNGCTFHGRTE